MVVKHKKLLHVVLPAWAGLKYAVQRALGPLANGPTYVTLKKLTNTPTKPNLGGEGELHICVSDVASYLSLAHQCTPTCPEG